MMSLEDDALLFCLNCKSSLHGLGIRRRCPECGVEFDLSDPKSFGRESRRHEKLFKIGKRFVLAGLGALALGWIPLVVYMLLMKGGIVPDSNLAGGFRPLACCITPPGLVLLVIGAVILYLYLRR
jgi:hypothetical protein